MPAKRKMDASQQITIRLDPALLDEADELIPLIRSKTGMIAVRNDVLRQAIILGLRDLRKEQERRG